MRKITPEGVELRNQWNTYAVGKRYQYLPAEIIEDINLSAQARLLFCIINSLSAVYGYCFATKETLGDKVGLKETMVKIYLKELRENKLIKFSKGGAPSFKRQIHIDFDGLKKRYQKKPIIIPPNAILSEKARRVIELYNSKLL